MSLETEQSQPEFKTDHSSIYLFFSWTSFRSCVCSSAVFCIRTPQRLQPFSAMNSGTSENSKTKEVMLMLSFEIRQLLNGFINSYITWNALTSFVKHFAHFHL